jgi:nucleoside-diphosphate-sugar epimerase
MKHDEYGVFNWFIRKAMDDEVIPVFGDGRILRDYLFVDDLIECLLMTAACDNSYGEIFNVGSGVPVNFIELAKKIIESAGTGSTSFAEFTEERKALEPGDYYADISKIKSTVGWQPGTPLEAGIEKTIEYYKKHKSHYW